jgi:hypothetical protein
MPNPNRQLIKVIQRIHRQLSGNVDVPDPPAIPTQAWDTVTRTAGSIAKARRHGWQMAARMKSQELVVQLEELHRGIDQALWQLVDVQAPRKIAGPGELYLDLIALQQEPFELEMDADEHELCVTTELVVLEGIDLGRFQIRLKLDGLQEERSYRVVALDPAPAASNRSVTHPHVNDEILCEGDGSVSVRKALAEGRLFDFFTMVDRLLHTYAAGRAHIELDQWQGTGCHDCGCLVDEDDYCVCTRCDQNLCPECSSTCTHCDQSVCAGCSICCDHCNEVVCLRCHKTCAECREQMCPECLNDQNLCPKCHEQRTESDDDTAELEEATAAESLPALHADGLGQTADAA